MTWGAPPFCVIDLPDMVIHVQTNVREDLVVRRLDLFDCVFNVPSDVLPMEKNVLKVRDIVTQGHRVLRLPAWGFVIEVFESFDMAGLTLMLFFLHLFLMIVIMNLCHIMIMNIC